MARGGGGHGGGGHGAHASHGVSSDHGSRERRLGVAPVYVLVSVSRITDAEGFRAAMGSLSTALGSLGRLAASADRVASWEGGGASEHLTMIGFNGLEQA